MFKKNKLPRQYFLLQSQFSFLFDWSIFSHFIHKSWDSVYNFWLRHFGLQPSLCFRNHSKRNFIIFCCYESLIIIIIFLGNLNFPINCDPPPNALSYALMQIIDSFTVISKIYLLLRFVEWLEVQDIFPPHFDQSACSHQKLFSKIITTNTEQ